MGEHAEFDALAMEAVAESLQNAVSDIALIGVNWPEEQRDSVVDAIDIQLESARLWTANVLERLEEWTQRARRISQALERHQIRRRR
jgi:hypothetical protein